MASNFSSEESDLEDFYSGSNITPYDFQPEAKRKKSDVENESSPSSSQSSDEEESREGNTDWCLCGHCKTELLVRDKEHLCCRERSKTKSKSIPAEGKDNYILDNYSILVILKSINITLPHSVNQSQITSKISTWRMDHLKKNYNSKKVSCKFI